MNLTININQNARTLHKLAEENAKNPNRKSVDARTLSVVPNSEDRVDSKKQSARRQAIRLMNDAWSRDERIAKTREETSDRKCEIMDQLASLKSQLDDIDGSREALRQNYEVEGDSLEQSDLELLEKYQNYKNGSAYSDFSQEEIERLKELQAEDMTDYQMESLKKNSARGELVKTIRDLEAEMLSVTETLTANAINQDKNTGMLQAMDGADAILAAANKEIFGMLMQDGIDHLDEKAAEEKKEAEEKAEKKAEEEERLEKAEERREERKELEKIVEKSMEADQLQNDVTTQRNTPSQVVEAQKSISKILKDNNLVNEDLKGIEIDLNF